MVQAKMRPLSEKMRLKAEEKLLILNSPEGWAWQGNNFVTQHAKAAEKYDQVLYFVVERSRLESDFKNLKRLIGPKGKIWIAWPKAKKLGTDLNLDEVVKVIYPLGMVESINLAIDETWTALKFTWPKAGKAYRDNHAILVRDPDGSR